MPHNYLALNSPACKKLPEQHIESLKKIESGYWWFLGRIYWVLGYAKCCKLSKTKKTSYIDIGCGTGGLAQRIKKNLGFDSLTLVDPNPHVSNEVLKDTSVCLFKKTAMDLDPAIFRADLITCCDVIEHIEDPVLFMSHLKKLLKPGGALILTTPAFQSLYSDWDKHLGHYRRYRKSLLASQLKDAGFEIDEISYFWAPLFPLGFLRKGKKRSENNMEFPSTPQWLNSLLIAWSKIELLCSRIIPIPFGTSLIVRARVSTTNLLTPSLPLSA